MHYIQISELPACKTNIKSNVKSRGCEEFCKDELSLLCKLKLQMQLHGREQHITLVNDKTRRNNLYFSRLSMNRTISDGGFLAPQHPLQYFPLLSHSEVFSPNWTV